MADFSRARGRWVIAAILVAVGCIVLSGWLLQEKNVEIDNICWRSLINAFGWGLSSFGGTILTSVILSFLLPRKLQETMHAMQSSLV